MDSFDMTLLTLLQQDSRTSTEALGEHVGLSASSCQRRIKKLKQQGIIKQEVAVLDGGKLPACITTIVDISLEKGGEQALDNVISTLSKEPQIQQLYYTAGDTDFTAIVVTPSMTEFDLLSRRLFMGNANIKRFNSKVVISASKTSLAIPITQE